MFVDNLETKGKLQQSSLHSCCAYSLYRSQCLLIFDDIRFIAYSSHHHIYVIVSFHHTFLTMFIIFYDIRLCCITTVNNTFMLFYIFIKRALEYLLML